MCARIKQPFEYATTQDFKGKLSEWVGDVLYDILPEKGYEERVSEVIMAHVGLLKPEVFRCHYVPVMDYVDKMNLALKKYKEEFSFTYPKTIGIDIDKRIQAIDGDMFA